jgi:hypothetical protein
VDGILQVFGWTIIRAVGFIAAVSAAVWGLTRDARLVRAYCAAHLLAILLGTTVDLAIVKLLMPRGEIPAAYMNAVFLAPIVFFIAFSLYICHRDVPLTLADVLLAIAPVVAWGLLVVFGWQEMAAYDILGAWFVSAACGGVDLSARFGPPALTRRPLLTKTLGYAASLLAVYLALPLTGDR